MVADVSVKPPVQPVYLGDGLYASFDGYQIWLHVGSHTTGPVVAIEPGVMQSLEHFADAVFERKGIE